MKRLILATKNENKLKEIKEILSDFEIITPTDMPEIEENGKTIEENSLIKAKAIYEIYKMPVIADDSGLIVKVLGDKPGVLSARYAGDEKDDNKNIKKLLSELQNKSNREAYFKTVITYFNKSYFQVEGRLDGIIAKEKRGNNGFGYDPIFLVGNKTLAEISSEEKNKISHRKKAVDKLKEKLNDIR